MLLEAGIRWFPNSGEMIEELDPMQRAEELPGGTFLECYQTEQYYFSVKEDS